VTKLLLCDWCFSVLAEIMARKNISEMTGFVTLSAMLTLHSEMTGFVTLSATLTLHSVSESVVAANGRW